MGNDAILAVAEARRGAALMPLGRQTPARESLEAAATLAEATGNFGTMSGALDNLAELFREEGDFDRSKMYLARALQAAEQSSGSGRIAWTLEQSGESCCSKDSSYHGPQAPGFQLLRTDAPRV